MAKRDGSTYQVDFSAHAVYATAHDYLVVATSTKVRVCLQQSLCFVPGHEKVRVRKCSKT